MDDFLARTGLPYTEFDGWLRIDAAERAAGLARGGDRVKIPSWDALIRLAQRT